MRELRTLPNQIAMFRLGLIPVMWVLVLLQRHIAVGVLLAVAGISDILDGYLARRLHQVTRVGSVLDTLADNALIISGLIWIPMIKREILIEHPVLSAVAIGLALTAMVHEWIKFRRFENLHLYTNKLTSFLAMIFFVHALTFGGYSHILFYIVTGTWITASLESLAIQYTCRDVDEHIGTIVRVWRRRGQASADAEGAEA